MHSCNYRGSKVATGAFLLLWPQPLLLFSSPPPHLLACHYFLFFNVSTVMEAQSKEPAQQGQEDNEKRGPDIQRSELDQQDGDQAKAIDGVEAGWDGAYLITFGPDDPENPLSWSKKLKWGITVAVSGTGFVRIMVSTVSTKTAPSI